MNAHPDMQCAWSTPDGYRCKCPAAASWSQFCVFHRHPEDCDTSGIVAWSNDATADEYAARAMQFAYRMPSPHATRLSAQIAAYRAGRGHGIAASKLDSFDEAA